MFSIQLANFNAEDIARLGLNTRIRILPLGVPNQPPSTQTVHPGQLLFLSRLHPKKRLENLLQALALVRRRQPSLPWRLVVAGSGDPAYVSSLQNLSQRLGLEQHCHWAGFATGPAKLELLQTSAWFVLPSAAENFAIAAAESLAAGTPVILSPEVGIAAEVEQAGAGLISRAEPGILADTLIQALQTSRDPYVKAALQLAHERYAWPVIAADLEAIYRDLIPATL
jgi:glycosyltransferase involved in cell wall biosynthesis